MNASNRTSDPWHWIDLGSIPYQDAYSLQQRLVAQRTATAEGPNLLLALEHPPVYTLGRRGGREFLTISDEKREAAGIDVIPTERGGWITYHGPGQLVVYPIIHLTRLGLGVARFVDYLEEAMAATAAHYGVAAGPDPKNRGVWAGAAKMGSIGLAVRKGITFHGLALNVAMDLTPFGWIHPCGMDGVTMTSLAAEGAANAVREDAAAVLIEHLTARLGVTASPWSRKNLDGHLAKNTEMETP